jgi:protein PhnA
MTNMSDDFLAELQERSGSQCELCGSPEDLSPTPVPPREATAAGCLLLCETCRTSPPSDVPDTHWFCLQTSIWSEVAAAQVLTWRLLHQLDSAWSKEQLEQAYLDEETLAWAEEGVASEEDAPETYDSNGTVLQENDSVTLIKDLDVKGAGFTAKRGTMVRRIRLTGDPAYIEGRINKTMIALKTCFLKKA